MRLLILGSYLNNGGAVNAPTLQWCRFEFTSYGALTGGAVPALGPVFSGASRRLAPTLRKAAGPKLTNVARSTRNFLNRDVKSFLPARFGKSRVGRALGSLYDDYWSFSKGISVDDARALAKAEGFGFELGRTSRFENARNSVIIGKNKLKDGRVNLIELAEEIQHGLDRATSEAGRFMRRNARSGHSTERLNELFHVEHFQRIIANWDAGKFQFLSADDIVAILKIIKELK